MNLILKFKRLKEKRKENLHICNILEDKELIEEGNHYSEKDISEFLDDFDISNKMEILKSISSTKK